MQTYVLKPHPAQLPRHVIAVHASVLRRDKNWLRLRWRIDQPAAVLVPPLAGKRRANDLWQTTCFELFLLPGDGPRYSEFNFSPSERWAAYDFDSYREGMRNRPVSPPPVCSYRPGRVFALFDANIPASTLPDEECAMNLSCVLEEEGGFKSLWALAHPEDAPDFHNAACFTASLPAPAEE